MIVSDVTAGVAEQPASRSNTNKSGSNTARRRVIKLSPMGLNRRIGTPEGTREYTSPQRSTGGRYVGYAAVFYLRMGRFVPHKSAYRTGLGGPSRAGAKIHASPPSAKQNQTVPSPAAST